MIALEQTRPDVIERRKVFEELQKMIPASKLVFIDETGVNRAMTKREAWAPIGFRAVDFVPGNRGRNVTLIGAVRLSGPVAMQTLEDSLNKESFSRYIRSVLVPKLEPGDVVILDNCPCHNDKEALDAIESVGAFVKFLPPYSPDLNPIEMVWNALKRRFERIDVADTAEIRAALRKAWRSLRSLPIFGLFASCSYLLAQPL